jgi:hypothetical protein
LDDWLRLTHPLLLLLLELALRQSDRDPKPTVEAAESDRGSRAWVGPSEPAAEDGRIGSSLPLENSSSARHMAAASAPVPAGARAPDDGMQNWKSSAASELEPSASAWDSVPVPAMVGSLPCPAKPHKDNEGKKWSGFVVF